MLVDKGRNVVADIEDEPDRDETGDAVKISLQKIANDVAIEESHREFEVAIWNFAILAHFADLSTKSKHLPRKRSTNIQAPTFIRPRL